MELATTLQSHASYQGERALLENSGHDPHIESVLSNRLRYEDYLQLIRH